MLVAVCHHYTGGRPRWWLRPTPVERLSVPEGNNQDSVAVELGPLASEAVRGSRSPCPLLAMAVAHGGERGIFAADILAHPTTRVDSGTCDPAGDGCGST